METSKKLVTRRWARGLALGLLLAACVPERASGPRDIEMMALSAAGTVKRLNVSNGYNSLTNMTLVQSGELFTLYAVDFDYADLEAGGALTLDFSNIALDETVQAVRVKGVVFVEPLEIIIPDPTEPPEPCGAFPLEPCESINPTVMHMQVGGGSLTNPFVAMEATRSIGITSFSNNISWDVTKWVNSAAKVNDLKLVLRNKDMTGEGVLSLDRMWLEITYGPTPAPVAMNWKVSLLPSDGWDSKNIANLTTLGTLGNLLFNEPTDPWGIVEAMTQPIVGGQSLSIQFNGIPSNATFSSAIIKIGFINGEGIDSTELIIDPTEPPEPPDPTEPPCGAFPLEPCVEPPDIFPGSAFLQVGTGSLISPTTIMEQELEVPPGEATVTWDVTQAARLASAVNQLKLVITNQSSLAELQVNSARIEIQFGPTAAAVAIVQTVSIFPTDAYSAGDGKWMAADGKLDYIRVMDGLGSSIESGSYVSVEFGNVATDKTVSSVKLIVTAYSEAGGTPNSQVWQAGGGTISAPFVAMERRPEGFESTVEWDVSPWFRTPGRVNDLTLTIRNMDPLGKKVTLDGAKLLVTYGPPRAKSTTGWNVTLFVVDGWDGSDPTKTLSVDGGAGVVNATDGQSVEIEAADIDGGGMASFSFNRIPGGSIPSAVRIKTRHHEEEGFAAGSLRFRAGGGTLFSPTTLVSTAPPILQGELAETVHDWGVGGTFTTASLVNNLKFSVKNNDLLGKKVSINRVFVTVNHKEAP